MLLSEDGAIKTCVRAASFIELCDKGKLDWGQSQNFQHTSFNFTIYIHVVLYLRSTLGVRRTSSGLNVHAIFCEKLVALVYSELH